MNCLFSLARRRTPAVIGSYLSEFVSERIVVAPTSAWISLFSPTHEHFIRRIGNSFPSRAFRTTFLDSPHISNLGPDGETPLRYAFPGHRNVIEDTLPEAKLPRPKKAVKSRSPMDSVAPGYAPKASRPTTTNRLRSIRGVHPPAARRAGRSTKYTNIVQNLTPTDHANIAGSQELLCHFPFICICIFAAIITFSLHRFWNNT